jgi:hypothetical protein
MKSVLTTAAALIVIATPALAQSFDPDVGTGNIAPPPVASQSVEGAYAQAPRGYQPRYAPQARKTHRPARYKPTKSQNDNGNE